MAGDTFDKNVQDYSDFDELCSRRKFANLEISVIPGNHDPLLSQKNLTSSNVNVYSTSGFELLGGKTRNIVCPLSERPLNGGGN